MDRQAEKTPWHHSVAHINVESLDSARERFVDITKALSTYRAALRRAEITPMHQSAVMASAGSEWDKTIGKIPDLERELSRGPRQHVSLVLFGKLAIPLPSRPADPSYNLS